MKKLKTILLIGIILLLVGGIIFVVCLGFSGWNFSFLSNVEQKSFEYVEDSQTQITDITIDYENANIQVHVDETPYVRAVYTQAFYKNGEHAATVTLTQQQNGLKIAEKVKASFFVWNFTAPTVELYLPAERTYTLNLFTDNGNITLNGQAYQTHSLFLESNNGNIVVNGEVHSQTKITAETNNGNVKIKQATATQSIRLQSNNGNITSENGLTAPTLYIETNLGNLSIANADGQNITLETNTGNITAIIVGKQADFTIVVDTDVGKSNLSPQTLGDKKLTVDTNVGNIHVTFVN